MYPSCHILLLCVLNSETYHLCIGKLVEEVVGHFGHLLRRVFFRQAFFWRAFFRREPIFFHLLRTFPPSYTTFVPFNKNSGYSFERWRSGRRRWRSGRRWVAETEVQSPEIEVRSKMGLRRWRSCRRWVVGDGGPVEDGSLKMEVRSPDMEVRSL